MLDVNSTIPDPWGSHHHKPSSSGENDRLWPEGGGCDQRDAASAFSQIISSGLKEHRRRNYVFSELLDELSARTHRNVPRQQFPLPGLFRAYQINSLNSASSRLRQSFTLAAVRLSLQGEALPPQLRSDMRKVFSHLSTGEAARLGRSLLSEVEKSPNRPIAAHLLSTLIGSRESIKDLTLLVKQIGVAALRAVPSKTLKNLVAAVELEQRLSKIKFPRAVSKFAPTPKINNTLAAIKETLLLRREAVDAAGVDGNSLIGRRLKQIIDRDLEYLSSERSRTRGATARRELTNTAINRFKLEQRLAIALSEEIDDESGARKARWSSKDIRDLQRLFKKLPESLIMATPKLAQIRLCAELKGGAYGQRDGTGLVKISTDAIDEPEISKEFRGRSSLLLVTLHEIGHSIKFGTWGDGRNSKKSIDELTDESSNSVDFRNFVRLSDWKVIPPSDYTMSDANQIVRANGRSFCVDDPVEFQGHQVVFRYDEGKRTLYSHAADAQFPVQAYGRANPWEDWTESWTDYIELPERLIEFAPWKFVYFEQLFHRHQNNTKAMKALGEALPIFSEGL